MSIRQGNKVIAGHINYHPDLFDHKWADHLLNDVSWLRADTFSWQDGDVYEAACQHLADDCEVAYAYQNSESTVCWLRTRTPQVGDLVYNNWQYTTDSIATIEAYDESTQTITLSGSWPGGEPKTFTRFPYSDKLGQMSSETIGGTTVHFFLADDGHKICPASEESNVAAIYTATGVAWYYILDTTNQRFKLPRIHPDRVKTGLPATLSVRGNGKTLGLMDGNGREGAIQAYVWNKNYYMGMGLGAASVVGQTLPSSSAEDHSGFAPLGVSTNSAKSGLMADVPATGEYYSGKKYLYFYVGNFTQTALENTAGLNAELFNGKVDTGHQVIAFQAPTAQNNYTWYRKYADGWVEQGGLTTDNENTTHNLVIPMADTNYVLIVMNKTVGNYYSRILSMTTTGFIADPSVGSNSKSGMWYVSGTAAN